MECPKCSLLTKDFEEQKTQIARYEAKIKDLVSAYKSLSAEKQSLEVALSLLSPAEEDKGESEQQKDEKTEENATETEKNAEVKLSAVHQIDSLKQAISTLTLVNKRKEMEFKKDRQTLLETRNQLQNRCSDLEQQLKMLKQQNRSQNLKQLRADLVESREAYEKAMTEHGLVLAELQQQYSKEKKHVGLLENQITEMSQRLAAKDEHIKRTEGRLRHMDNLEQQMETLRKKAEITPTVRVIKDELANVKSSLDKELNVCRSRSAIQEVQLREKEGRVEQLEQRVREVSERCAQAERRNIELEMKVADCEKADALKTERAKREREARERPDTALGEGTVAERFQALYKELLKLQPDADPIAMLLADSSFDLQRNNEPNFVPLDCPKDSLSPSTPVPSFCSKSPSSGSLNAVLHSAEVSPAMADDENLCAFCLSSRKELDHFKSLLGHLQRKLSTLEENHELTKKQHESAADLLRQRIVELENSKQRSYLKLTAEARQKVTELEDELAKQRTRIAEVIAEKDREIELTKYVLSAHFEPSADHFGPNESVQTLPMDPQPKNASSTQYSSASTHMKCNSKGAAPSRNHGHVMNKIGKSIGDQSTDEGSQNYSSVDENSAVEASAPQADFSVSFRSASSRRMSHSSAFAAAHSTPTGAKATAGAGVTTRNIFYEQELSKREQEIGELRNVIRLLELKVRDIEQAMLLKDVQYLQIIETLKEEIRVLEGRLALESTQTNMAYLRNIFVQFVGQGSVSGRRHILKAIGAVLQLTAAEMRRIDRWSY